MENHHHAGHGRGPRHHPPASNPSNDPGPAFAAAVALNVAFVLIEAGAGFWADSLALLADAGHNLSDVLALLLAWGAAALARRTPTTRYTFGLRSTTILAAFANAVLLLAASGAIAFEAIARLRVPSDVSAPVVIAVAAAGVVLNTLTAALFLRGRHHDLNVRGAFLHMAGDALVSLAVVLAGILILWTGQTWIDSAASLLVVAVILVGTWQLARDSLRLVLQAVPAGIDAQAVRRFLASRPGVSEVHDLHIWGMSTTESALSAHLVMPGGSPGDAFLSQVCADLEREFRIGHATLQIEFGDPAHPCPLQPENVV